MDLVKVKTLGSKSLFVDKDSLNYFVIREYDLEDKEMLSKLAKLSNTVNIPKIINVKKGFKKITTVEEYIQGQTLAEIIDSGKYITDDLLAMYTLELCTILKEIHRVGIIHKDIKPNNIVVSVNGIYIIDFDISRTYKEEQTRDTKLYATEGYASPEQYGFSQTTAKSDVYSLGKTLEELLAATIVSPDLYTKYNQLIMDMTELDPDKRIDLDTVILEVTLQTNNIDTNSQTDEGNVSDDNHGIANTLKQIDKRGIHNKFIGLIINKQSITLSVIQSIVYFGFGYLLIIDEYANQNPTILKIVLGYYFASVVTNFFIVYVTRKVWGKLEDSNIMIKGFCLYFKVMLEFVVCSIIIQWPFV